MPAALQQAETGGATGGFSGADAAYVAYVAMLDGLAVQAGLDAAELRAHQEISLDGNVVALSRAGAALQCVCAVLQFPPESPPRLLQLLMQANTLGRPTQGATLGLLRSRDLRFRW